MPSFAWGRQRGGAEQAACRGESPKVLRRYPSPASPSISGVTAQGKAVPSRSVVAKCQAGAMVGRVAHWERGRSPRR